MNTERRFNLWIINHYAGNRELGMEYRHFFLARHLRHLGHAVGIVASSYHHLFTTPPECTEPVTRHACDDVPFVFLRTPSYKGNGLRRLSNMLAFSRGLNKHHKAVEEYLEKPDAVLASSPHPFVVNHLLRLRRRYNVPALFEVRDLWPQMLIDLGFISRHHPLSYWFGRLENKAYRQCDRVFSLWHSAHEYMLQRGLDRRRYVYLPNGIELTADTGRVDMDTSNPLLRHVQQRREAGKFIVGYGGSHGHANPVQSILEACKILQDQGVDDVEFFLVGDGPVKAQMIACARDLNLKNIHFHGSVHKPVIMRFYDRIDVAFIGLRDLPLFRYGPTPNKLMDYLAMAKPIISAIRSPFDPVATEGLGRSIPPDDAPALVNAVLELKALPASELRAMGAAGRSYAERELNLASIARRLATEVQTCIAERAGMP